MKAANDLRAALAERLSAMYATEVPKYAHLVEATNRVNAGRGDARDANRVGTERHGAIRLATFDELAQIARLFRVFGMEAVGYYDLRTGDTPLPIVATAFRPIAPADLEASPFRMFTSTLVADDERFFDPLMQADLVKRAADRAVFSTELLEMLDQAEASGGVAAANAGRFVSLSVDLFRLNLDPVEAEWHQRLDEVSPVASDIAAGTGTHLNHLTPRVLDIDVLHQTMEDEGVEMIARIQGPPPWSGPDVLLRQTSFRALDENRRFADADGNEFDGVVRVRFGEVEQRGIALTPQGRAKVDAAMTAGATASNEPERRAAIRAALDSSLGHTLEQLATDGDAYVRHVTHADGSIDIEPITYEDFLPASAAGIFASNLAHAGSSIDDDELRVHDAERLRAAVGELHDPYALYQAQQDASLAGASPKQA